MVLHEDQTKQSFDAPIRVLVVDDSAFMRYTITENINNRPGLSVVGNARNGQQALELIPKLKPDVITLDIEMPVLDGLSTLREIMSNNPIPVIMLSSLTADGSFETIQALTLGAVDFVLKPTNKANVATVMDDVAAKIFQAAAAKISRIPSNRNHIRVIPRTVIQPEHTKKTEKYTREFKKQDKIVIIGSSTGGPKALHTVIPALSTQIQAAVLIVQHMPAKFTQSLADRLDTISIISVKEAEEGDRLQVGQALLAPGGFHMKVNKNGEISLNKMPPVHGVRPSVDVTMMSLAENFGSQVIGVVLTGMGRDGTNGSALIRSCGGKIIAEDESSCVVWGMPRSVYEAGQTDIVVPLDEIADQIQAMV
jgi:two-component system chemotaxis response regulator CheB